MSLITNVVLYSGLLTEQDTDYLDLPITVGNREQWLVALDTEKSGGHKVFVGDVYAGALNHVVAHDLFDHLAAHAWTYPEELVAIAHTDNEPPLIWRPEKGIS